MSKENTLLDKQFELFLHTYREYSTSGDYIPDPGLKDTVTLHNTRYNQVKINIDKYIEKSRNLPRSSSSFRLEKTPLPRFDGNIRNYAQFKSDFNKMILPTINLKEAAFVLRQCVSDAVKDYVRSCDDDVTKMFERLDVKYGEPSKLIESILYEIHKLKVLEADDYKHAVNFVDFLEM